MNGPIFREGDIVYLKIGGPTVIINKKEAHSCNCLYLLNGEVKSTSVAYEALSKEKPTT